MGKIFSETEAATTVAAGVATTVMEGEFDGEAEVLTFEISNTGGTNAFSAFTFQIQAHKNAAWVTKLSAWAAAGAILLFTSADLAALAHSTAATAQVRVDGAYAVRLQATSVAGTTALCRWTARGA